MSLFGGLKEEIDRPVEIAGAGQMLRRAQQRASETCLSHTLFINTDASTHGFEAGKADLAFSRYGVMFFANPIAAFVNRLRTTRRHSRRAREDAPAMLAPTAAE